jgi:hypothetical protein
LRNKALAGAFEVTNYSKGKEGTQFGDKINRMYPQGAECIFCGDPREDFYHILVKCPQWKGDRDNIKCKVSEISQTNVEEWWLPNLEKYSHEHRNEVQGLIGFVPKSLKETIKQKLGPNSTRKEVLEKCQQIIRTVYEGLHQIYRKRCKELWKRKREQGIAEFRTGSIT